MQCPSWHVKTVYCGHFTAKIQQHTPNNFGSTPLPFYKILPVLLVLITPDFKASLLQTLIPDFHNAQQLMYYV